MKVAIIADFTSMKKHSVQVFISEKQLIKVHLIKASVIHLRGLDGRGHF